MSEIGQNLRGRFPVKRAVISENTAASNEIVAAVTNKKIVVLNVTLTTVTGQTLTWQSNTTAISGAMAFLTSDLLYHASDGDNGVLETEVGEALKLLMGAATQVSGHLSYVEV